MERRGQRSGDEGQTLLHESPRQGDRAKVLADGRPRRAPEGSDTLQITEALNSTVIKLSLAMPGSALGKERQKDTVREQ